MNKNDPRREPTDEELDELNEHWRDPGDPDGVIAAEEDRRWQAQQRGSSSVVPIKYHRKRRWPKVLLVLVLLVAATYGAYWYGDRQGSSPAPKTSTAQTASPKPAQTTKAPLTTHYDSNTYTIGFDYLQTWKMADTATKLTVASPVMQFTTAAGKQVSGHILMTVRHKQTVISEFADGPARAALESQKLTYKNPTSIQRAQTYLSFLRFASAQDTGLDALYITGDIGYMEGQAIQMADVTTGDPLINVTFANCASDDCSTGTVTLYDVALNTWQLKTVSQPVTDLLQLLTLN
jgi:hypothetical protein